MPVHLDGHMITAGIDAGSRSTKVVVFDSETSQVRGSGVADQVVHQGRLAEELLCRTCAENGIDRAHVTRIVATGYGRNVIEAADSAVTEITCHARGVHHLMPEARTIIEIGGQDSKCIFVEPGGRVRDFAMNDRCAAGSGRFLEMVATRLQVSLSALGDLGEASREPAPISSMCAVFAETEIIGLLAQGRAPADIAAGVQSAVAGRVAAMAGRALRQPVCFTGGVALQPGMARALQEALSVPVTVCSVPLFTGALGAALIACRDTLPALG